jgi:addiction module HigA family antidote
MTMKNPPHPGQTVGDSLDELGVSVGEAAAALGVTRQQLHNVIAGRCSISPEMAFRLAAALGSTADAWLRLQANYDLAQLRARAASFKVVRLTPKVV